MDRANLTQTLPPRLKSLEAPAQRLDEAMIDIDSLARERDIDFSAGEECARWEAWCVEVERLAGIGSLDGDQDRDGYSLDRAFDAWEVGVSAAEYAASIVRRGS